MDSTNKQPGLFFRIIVSVGVCVYIFAVAVWMSPASRVKERLSDAIAPVLMYTGLWQNFAVFSPEPRFNNMFLSAVVTCADGSTQYFEFPRNDKLPLLERIPKERFRKYGLDNMTLDGNRMLWPDAARYVARKYRHKMPTFVSLQRHWQDIPPPQVGLGKPLPSDFHVQTFFVLTVKPEDLQ